MLRLPVLIALLLLCGCATLGSPQLREHAAQAYAAGDYEAAATAYESLTRQSDEAEDWYRLGNVYAQLDRPEDAAAAWRSALERDPGHARARHNLGLVYLRLGVGNLLGARLALPEVDAAAAATMRYLACIMEIFMGQPDPLTCRDPSDEKVPPP